MKLWIGALLNPAGEVTESLVDRTERGIYARVYARHVVKAGLDIPTVYGNRDDPMPQAKRRAAIDTWQRATGRSLLVFPLHLTKAHYRRMQQAGVKYTPHSKRMSPAEYMDMRNQVLETLPETHGTITTKGNA